MINAELCVRCKGYKRLCGLPRCPILEKVKATIEATARITGLEVSGSTPPTAIVGEKNYPFVPIVVGVPPEVTGEDAKIYDDPLGWWGRLGLPDILRLKGYQISSVMRANVNEPFTLYEKEVGIAAISAKPVDTDVVLERPPRPITRLDPFVGATGPSAPAKEVRVVGNASLPRKLEEIIWDDVSAEEAIPELIRGGVDTYTIIRAMSLGFIGRLRRRKLVPTRWAITAVDRAAVKYFLNRLRDLPSVDNVSVHVLEYLMNRFYVILYPGNYHVEWLEVWRPRTGLTERASSSVIIYSRDYGTGKTSTLDGGFDAARHGLVRALYERGRKASAIIIRIIEPGYVIGVGNWHIRETVYRAVRSEGITFDTLSNALAWVAKAEDKDVAGALKKLVAVSTMSLDAFAGKGSVFKGRS